MITPADTNNTNDSPTNSLPISMALSDGNGCIFRTLYPALQIVIRDVILCEACPIPSKRLVPVVDLENSCLIRFDKGFDSVLITNPANLARLEV